MRNSVLVILIATLTLCGIALAQETKSTNAKVFIEETNFDFGYIPGGEVVSHSYYLHSRGTDSLKILNVKPGCGCTKAPLKKDVVAVGDSANVELVFTSSKGGRGAVSKSATVTCNDNDRSNFQLTFKGMTYDSPDSLRPLSLSDATIKIDAEGRSKEAKLEVKNVSKTNVRIHLVSQPSDYLKIDVPDSEIKPGKEKEIKVRVNPLVNDEEFKKSFTFAVNDSAGTRYTVPVLVTKAADVTQTLSSPDKKVEGTH
ncbi:MAG: DUF1573 domain-containing protein [candidate division Zixibacteria bacterium]|nr:DUF1573 domain-containing protein [candidate division Zixibacteria bacterium]